MVRNNKNIIKPYDKGEKMRYLGIIGFLSSIIVFSLAFLMSINQNNIDKMAQEYNMNNNNYIADVTLSATSDISKSINEVSSYNTINIVAEQLPTSSNIDSNLVIDEPVQEENQSEENTESAFEDEEVSSSVNNNDNSEPSESAQFIKPIDGDVYKEFSMDSLIYSDTLQEWVTHRGIDIKSTESDDVKASANGTIKSIKNDPRYGWSITIEHNDGFCTIYSCLSSADLLNEGDSVEQGQIIGKIGNSGVFEVADGSHLHFEITKDGKFINPEMYF